MMGIDSWCHVSSQEPLAIINICSAGLSIIGSTATIISYFINRDRKQQLYSLILWLSIADLIASTFIILSQGVVYAKGHDYPFIWCVVFRSVIQFFFTSSFCWTAAVAVHLYRASNHKPEHVPLYLGYHIFAWGIPAILLGIALIAKQMERPDSVGWCELKVYSEWALWFIPLLLSVFVNLLLYILILKSFRKTYASHKKVEGVVLKRVSLYLLAFIICWIWDIIGHIVETTTSCEFYPLLVMQVLFAPLQGFLNFFVYGLSNRMLNRCFRKSSTNMSSLNESTRLVVYTDPEQ